MVMASDERRAVQASSNERFKPTYTQLSVMLAWEHSHARHNNVIICILALPCHNTLACTLKYHDLS
jgi:hypothetical protein